MTLPRIVVMMVSRDHIRRPAIDSWFVALFIVLVAAFAVRLYGIDWDDGADLHPDELFIAKIVLIDRIYLDWPLDIASILDPNRSSLNPRTLDPTTGKFREFAYGTLPLFVTDGAAWVLSRITGTNWNSIERVYLVGRAISAGLSALTVLPIAALGAAAGGRSVGLLAALFAAMAPMSIQLAHFFTTDSWLTCFVAICLLASLAAARIGGPRRFLVAGALFGLAMATKSSGFALAAPILAALAIDAHRRLEAGFRRETVLPIFTSAIAAAAAALVAFLVFEPFALLQPDGYLHSIRVQADIASGAFDVPFTRVYAGTVPVLYQLEQLFRWGYGPAAAALAIAGIAMLISVAVRRRLVPALILMSWFIAYGAVIVLSDVKFIRYLEPLAPVLAVGAALTLSKLMMVLGDHRPILSRQAIPLAALGLCLAWTGAFLSIYAHEHPRLAASRWLYAVVPPGSNLTAEYWDDALPRSLGYSLSPSTFGLGSITLDLYRDLPPPEASDAIYAGIHHADFVIQSSERVAAAVAAAPWRYPIQGRFFDQLQAGTLGFDRVATFARPPSIGIVPIDDRHADESFVNYDHPRVSVYERTRSISRSEYDDAMSWAFQRPWSPTREPPEPTLLLDGPVGDNPAVSDARWSAVATQNTPVALAVWIVMLLALLAIGVPIAKFLLPSFPDRGWGLARTLALVLAAYPLWLGASLSLFRFRAIWVVVALVAVGTIGWWLSQRGRNLTGSQRTNTSSRTWLHAEAAFWLVLGLFLIFRLINPDGWHPFWGGEKPMEFAQLNAIQRSAYFPPYDPWYADGYLNYYYYGFYVMAFLLKATGIPSEIGFNLALPTVMGLVASGGFSMAAALALGLTRSPRLAIISGWIGTVLLCLAGNLTAVRGMVNGGPAGADPFLYWTWSGSRAIDNAITEFPFFSGLYADLHAHVIALPLTLATIALCYSIGTIRIGAWSDTGAAARESRKTLAARLAVLSLLLGSLTATNAWDVPVYATLAVAALFMATGAARSWLHRVTVFAPLAILTISAAWLLFLPFHRHFSAQFFQLALVRDPTDLLQFLSHFGGLLTICVVGLTVLMVRAHGGWIGSPIWPWLTLAAGGLGVLALLAGSAELAPVGEILIVSSLAGPPAAASWLLVSHARNRTTWRSNVLKGVIIAAALAGAWMLGSERPVLGLLLALGVAAGVGWICLNRRPDRFLCLLLAAGFLTAAGAEIVVVADDLIDSPAYRMNTIFKFYNQVWVLLAVAAAALVVVMIRDAASWRGAAARGRTPWYPTSQAWARFGLGAFALVLLASLTYPVLATGPRLAQQFSPGTASGTLNALGWMQTGTVAVHDDREASEIEYAGDAAAIAWFFANVTGSPVIAEASIGPYRCNGSRIASATGLPTIIGWERHERQQRDPATLPARVADVHSLFTSTDTAEKASILRRYNVGYVVVGDLERIYPIANNECSPTGNPEGIAAFDAMIGTTLEPVHTSGGTTIYRVLPIGTE